MITRSRHSLFAISAILAGTLVVAGSHPAALASPLGVTRSAVPADDGVVDVVRFGGGVRRGNIGMARPGSMNVGRHATMSRSVNRTANVNRNVNRNVNVNRNINRNVNRTVVRTGAWARPGGYWWRPGGAVVAGAALGFVTAASAAAWAGAAPGPNLCWYYTDATRQQGFWDACP
jgi:hypothetical protein